MRVHLLAKSFVLGVTAALLASCGGDSASNGCISGGIDCVQGSLFDAMGVDGPMANAQLRVVDLPTWIAFNGGGDSLIDAASIDQSDAQGLATGVELAQGAGNGPFLLQFNADADTIDTTTGVFPVIAQVYTVISAADFALSPRPRFYATALTTLAIERAKMVAGAGVVPSDGQLAAAAVETINNFGFGIDNTIDIFRTAPILDQKPASLPPLMTEAEYQLNVAAYRTALETLAEVVEEVAVQQATTATQVFNEMLADFSTEGLIGGNVDPVTFVVTGTTAIQAAFVAEVNSVTATYLTDAKTGPNTPRLPASDGSADLESLLDGENIIAQPLAGGIGSLVGVVPSDPDFDGDSVSNNNDDGEYDPNVTSDSDGDGVPDGVGPGSDNCPNNQNGPLGGPNNQLDTDLDGLGDVCDDDADNDGVDGPFVAGPDVDDADDTIAIDADSDGVDDLGNTGGGTTFNPTHPDGAGTADNCVLNAVDDLGGNIDITRAPNPSQANLDGDAFGDACDNDADGDTFLGDGAGGPGADPNDLDAGVVPGETDGDGVADLLDNCPATSNPLQENVGTLSLLGDACDPDDDGFPSTDQNTVAVGEIGEGIAVDNCPNDANGALEDNQVDNDADGLGDACDPDDDNDSIPDLADADPFATAVTYHFDMFYTQQSSDAGFFKLSTISESVLQTGGTVIDAGSSNTFDLGNDADGVGTYAIGSDYETVEDSVDFDETPCAGAGCFIAATATTVAASTQLVSANDAGNVATYTNPGATIVDGTTATFSPWGVSAFVGTGRFDLNGVGSVRGANAEQGLVSIVHTDGTSLDGDLNGTYGFVDLSVSYGSGASAANALVNTTSRIYDATFDGAGNVTAVGAVSRFDASVGNADGSVTFDAGAIGAVSDTYSVSLSGATTLAFSAETAKGITDAAGELIVLSDGAKRGYGVKLGSPVAADIVGAYNLQGLVIQPDVDPADLTDGKLLAYSLEGVTITFTESAGNITASLSIPANPKRDVSTYAPADDALPSVTTDFEPPSNSGNSLPFTLDANGRFGPVVFGAGIGQKPFVLDGFFVDGKGILMRYIETNFTDQGAGGTTTNFFVGDPSTVTFVDPDTGIPVVPQPTTNPSAGFIIVGTPGVLTKLTGLAGATPNTPQVFSTLTAPADTDLLGDGFGQGIVWGIPAP